MEEGNGLVLAPLIGEQLPQGHASAGEHHQVLGPHGGINGITQSGLGELWPTPLEELVGALEVARNIHGNTPEEESPRGQRARGWVIPGDMQDESRVVELELRYMQQQELLQELSEVLYAQRRELDALRAEVDFLKKKLEGDPGLVDARQQEKPPHY